MEAPHNAHLRTLLSDDADGLGLLEFVKTLSSEKTEYLAAAIYCMRNMRDICLEGPPGTMKTSIGRFLDKIGPLLHVTVKVKSGEKAAGTNRCPHAVTLGKDMSFGIFDRSSSEYVHAISSNAKKLAAYVPKGREPVVRMWTEGAKSRGELSQGQLSSSSCTSTMSASTFGPLFVCVGLSM